MNETNRWEMAGSRWKINEWQMDGSIVEVKLADKRTTRKWAVCVGVRSARSHSQLFHSPKIAVRTDSSSRINMPTTTSASLSHSTPTLYCSLPLRPL